MSEFPEAKHAFAVNLPGPVLYSGFQVFGIFLLAFSPALALTACGLRVYSRRLSTGLGLDDWLIFLAAVLSVPQAVFATLFLRAGGWGIHEVDLPPNIPWNQGAFWAYLNRVFYTPLLVLVKISALLFLLRLGGTKRSVRLACNALIGFLLAQGLAFLPTTIFMCEPISFAWLGTREGSCLRGDYYTVALAATNILTDILTLLVPFVAFLGIKLYNRVRFALLGVFALGALVTFTSVLRLYYVLRIWWIEPEDRHYSLGYTLNTVEANLAIVTATIPALWPLGRLWFPAMFESMGINRPYLYPDIEVGYVLSQPRSSQQATGSTGAGSGSATTQAGRPALRGKILWLQRPRQPSFLRPSSPPSGGGGAGIGNSMGLTDIRGQRVFGVTAGRRRNRAGVASGDDDNEDGFEDYHEMIRRTQVSLVHGEEDGASTLHKPLESDAGGARSSSEIRGGGDGRADSPPFPPPPPTSRGLR